MKKKILICDDDQGILEMLELILDDGEHEVLTESNSLKVYDLLKTEKPDLLILDLWMPVLSGDQITRHLRANDTYKELPVLVMSASRDGEEIARRSGADAYLAKPFDINELVEKVSSLTQAA
ncbi:response regulator [Mucilaginibacter sp. CAU 1740]|uniref:response regulator n=1 Tax=Mucilaginibacter sp. CAU 1740 TaxID=3140365 RepID=UPI00325BB3A0